MNLTYAEAHEALEREYFDLVQSGVVIDTNDKDRVPVPRYIRVLKPGKSLREFNNRHAALSKDPKYQVGNDG